MAGKRPLHAELRPHPGSLSRGGVHVKSLLLFLGRRLRHCSTGSFVVWWEQDGFLSEAVKRADLAH